MFEEQKLDDCAEYYHDGENRGIVIAVMENGAYGVGASVKQEENHTCEDENGTGGRGEPGADEIPAEDASGYEDDE